MALCVHRTQIHSLFYGTLAALEAHRASIHSCFYGTLAALEAHRASIHSCSRIRNDAEKRRVFYQKWGGNPLLK